MRKHSSKNFPVRRLEDKPFLKEGGMSPTPRYRALRTLNLNMMPSKSLNLMSLMATGEGLSHSGRRREEDAELQAQL